MQALLPFMMVYAAAGLILSLVVHVLSFFGISVGGQTLFSALHTGIFPLWLPVVLISQKVMPYAGRGYRKQFWKILLSGCPPWMKYMTYGFFYYAIANFILFIAMAGWKPGGGSPPITVWHGFSGHWMAFYSVGLAVSTSAYRRGIDNLAPRCRNGHSVGLDDAFCPTCGAQLKVNPSQAAA